MTRKITAVALLATSLATAVVADEATKLVTPASFAKSPAPAEHPLQPALVMAEEALGKLRAEVQDYTCTITRRERVGGKLRSYETLNAKVRHASADGATPFSVYVNFLKPKQVAGREALFVAGENDGKLLVRRGGARMGYVSTYLDPTGSMAMEDNRYAITEIGFERLLEQLIERIKGDIRHGACQVRYFDDAKLEGRACTGIEATHPTEAKGLKYHRAVVLIDKELFLPVGYAAFWWPEKAGGKPQLLEEYYYTNIRTNVGLTDADFDRDNPAYKFFERDPADASQTVGK